MVAAIPVLGIVGFSLQVAIFRVPPKVVRCPLRKRIAFWRLLNRHYKFSSSIGHWEQARLLSVLALRSDAVMMFLCCQK